MGWVGRGKGVGRVDAFVVKDTRYMIQDNFIALYNKDYISTMCNKVKLHILGSRM